MVRLHRFCVPSARARRRKLLLSCPVLSCVERSVPLRKGADPLTDRPNVGTDDAGKIHTHMKTHRLNGLPILRATPAGLVIPVTKANAVR